MYCTKRAGVVFLWSEEWCRWESHWSCDICEKKGEDVDRVDEVVIDPEAGEDKPGLYSPSKEQSLLYPFLSNRGKQGFKDRKEPLHLCLSCRDRFIRVCPLIHKFVKCTCAITRSICYSGHDWGRAKVVGHWIDESIPRKGEGEEQKREEKEPEQKRESEGVMTPELAHSILGVPEEHTNWDVGYTIQIDNLMKRRKRKQKLDSNVLESS